MRKAALLICIALILVVVLLGFEQEDAVARARYEQAFMEHCVSVQPLAYYQCQWLLWQEEHHGGH